MIWTNEAHSMVWRYVRPTPAPISTLDADPALWFWIIAALSYGLLALGTSLLVLNLASPRAMYRAQHLVLVCAVLIPWGANGLSLVEFGPIPNLDLTPLAFPLAAAVLGLGIWRLRLLDVFPVAREEVLENLTDGMIALDASNRVLDMNPAAERILGTTASEAAGQPLARLTSCDTRFVGGRGLATLLGRYVEEGRAHAEVSIGQEPEQRHYSLILSQLGDKRRAGRLLALRDTTEQKHAEDRLDRLAHYDSLTNLPNRRLFYDRLEQALAQARRRKTELALLFLDLDHFKQINDTLGHEVGDLLLKALAERLVGCVRESDTVSRLAGDEFVVLLVDISGPQDASRVAQRIIQAVSDTYHLEEHEIVVTTSVGICFYPQDGQDRTTLLRNADAAMYRAKMLGRNRFEFYEEEMSAGIRDKLGLEVELKRALERGEFGVYYHPIISLENGKVFGAEALARWQHPERGLLSPSAFLPAAKESRLIIPIGQSVLEEGCAQVNLWNQNHPADRALTLCVNLSAEQLNHPDLARNVVRTLEETGLAADSLTLEIAETDLMADCALSMAILERLKSLGVTLAVDDFGTGRSSLPYLNRFPVDFLKIDHSLISGLAEDSEKETVVAATIDLAHALEMRVVAEGVETSQQLARLRRLGCDLLQGHYFSEALPSDRAGQAISFINRYYD